MKKNTQNNQKIFLAQNLWALWISKDQSWAKATIVTVYRYSSLIFSMHLLLSQFTISIPVPDFIINYC
jgi:hypothetical protein